jgi:hypothetical protein
VVRIGPTYWVFLHHCSIASSNCDSKQQPPSKEQVMQWPWPSFVTLSSKPAAFMELGSSVEPIWKSSHSWSQQDSSEVSSQDVKEVPELPSGIWIWCLVCNVQSGSYRIVTCSIKIDIMHWSISSWCCSYLLSELLLIDMIISWSI